MALQHLRSSTANKRPLATALSDGQLAVNTEATSPGLFFKNASGSLVKVGPVHVGATAPNASPASGGETGNTVGEQWLDTSGTNPVLKIWDGSSWASEIGEFVSASGDTMTGALVMDNQQQVRFRETTANGTNYIAIQAPASVSSDKTLTLPDVTGTLVSTGDTGTVTSTMLANGTIVDTDINASAAIAHSKLASVTAGSVLMGNASNIATATTVTGDVTISSSGVTAIASGAVVDADVNANAAIAHTKLANITAGSVLMGNVSNVPTATALSGDVTINSSGVTAISTGAIVNADVNASAAIAGTKISPDFGAQNVTTTGTSAAASFIPSSATVPTNGVYLPAANSVGISTNGVGRLFVDASGNVGVGSDTPLAAAGYATLRVNGSTGGLVEVTSNGTRVLQVQTNGAAAGAQIMTIVNGSDPPLVFGTNSTERLRITSAGLVGIGTSAPDTILHLASGNPIFLFQELDQAANSQRWGIQSEASILKFRAFNDAMSSAVDALSLTRSGSVGIGTTNPISPLVVSDGGAAGIEIRPALSDIISFNRVAGTWGNLILNSANNIFQIQGGEVGRFDNSGRLLVGTSSSFDNNSIFQATSTSNVIAQFYRTSGQEAAVVLGSTTGTLGSPSALSQGNGMGAIYFRGYDGAAWQYGATIIAYADGQTWASGDCPTRLVFSTCADAASSPTERIIIKNTGATYFNINASNTATVVANKSYAFIYGAASNRSADFASASDVVAGFNRNASDGNIIEFMQDGTVEGNINVSGTTVALAGAHLNRWSQIPGIDPYDKDQRPEILRGTVMSNLDEMCDWVCPESGDCQDNEQLNKTKISEVEGDKNVAGVFQGWDDDDDTWVNDFYLAMTGDFVIRIAAGVSVERGDLLMSAGDGTAKPQEDDIIRSKTIAKVTSTNVSCTYEDGSYCVPCVLMAC